MQSFIQEENQKIRKQSLWRSLAVLEKSKPSEIILDGEKHLNFSSNDYLGYSAHPEVVLSAKDALDRYGAGGRSSRLISGTLDLHKKLEEELAEFKGTESSLVFPSGYMANLGVISALLGEGDAVMMDQLNHASLIDAAKLAKCRVFIYEHCSMDKLEKLLHRTKSYKKRLVVTDSIFSMDGDFAPLKQMVELCTRNKVWLMIDDAHATGIFGEKGVGMTEHFNLMGKIEIVMGTLSKALGSQGGFVCGSKELIEYLQNKARSFIYTTALSPASCTAASKSLELVKREPQKRKLLLELSARLRNGLKESMTSNSQIVPYQIGSTEKSIQVSEMLKSSRIFAPAIRPPTVPKNECRLRFSVTSEHTEKDIDTLLKMISQI